VRLVRGLLAAALMVAGTPVAAQVSDASVDGYSVAALLGYWNAAVDIEDRHRFDHNHADTLGLVDDGQPVLTVDRYSEDSGERSRSRQTLVAHCHGDGFASERPRGCRYRLVHSSVTQNDLIVFDAAGAAARVRAAGMTPDAFHALYRAAPPVFPEEQFPDRWVEVRRIHDVIIAPVLADYAANSQITIRDSQSCPSMLGLLQQLDGADLPPVYIPGIGNPPPYRPTMPHGPSVNFTILAGATTVRWGEGSVMTPVGRRILDALHQIGERCPG
jgi:hypothetical protein